MEKKPNMQLPKRRLLVLFFVLAVLIVSAGSYWFYRSESSRLLSIQYQALTSMGDLKEGQLAWWLAEREADAERAGKNAFLIHYGARFLANRGDRKTAAVIREWLQAQRMGSIYSDALLVDTAGNTILAARDDSRELNEITRKAIPRALAENRPIQGDFYLDTHNGKTKSTDSLATVRDREGRVLFFVVLKSDAGKFIFPLLQSWHTFSKTGESLLVRREGDKVLYLNDLRHQANTGFLLHFPLTKVELPAVQAVLGRQGIFAGQDYRGVPVLADIRGIPGTPWFLVTKVDRKEILEDIAAHAKSMVILSVLVTFIFGLTIVYYYRRRQVGVLWKGLEAERARREGEERFRATLYSIGDGVIVTDAAGLVRQMNPVAERLTGWREIESLGLPLQEVFNIISEETRGAVDNPVHQVLREGTVVGLANHTLLLAKDGVERPIADSAAPIRNEEGLLVGVVLVFRDQTEERVRERQIRESERKLATLLANLPGLAYRCLEDENWTAEFFSEGCLALTGFHPEEFIDNRVVSLEMITHPDDRAYVRREVAAAQAQQRSYTLEYRVSTREGGEKWVWERGQRIAAEEGKAPRIEGFIMDISDRKRAEEQLRQSQFLLSQTIDFLPDATFAIDTQGKVITWNRAMETLTGIAATDMIGKGDYAYSLPFYGKRRPIMVDLVLAADDKTAATYVSFHREPGRILSETRLADFRGRGETWLWNMASLLCDDRGEILGAIESIRDITLQKKREQELEEALSLLDSALEATADGILVVDLNGKIKRWNRKFLDLFRLSEELISSQDDSLIFEHIKPQMVAPEAIANIRQNQYAHPEQPSFNMIEFKDGRVFERHSQPHLQGGAIIGRVLSFHDFTAQRQAEEASRLIAAQFHQAQKMEAVGRLAGGIAHDFNNMLNVILGQAELTSLKLGKDAPVAAHINEIIKVTQRSAELVRQLLGYARKQIITPRVIDLNETAETLLTMLRRLIGEDIDLVWKPCGHLWPVKIDPSQLNQLLTNLTVNARDAITDQGKITIETANVEFDDLYCDTHLGFSPGRYVMLAISDNGCGMDKEVMDRLFEPFFTTKPTGVGTGLGLATVYGVVKQNGGFINVYSEVGRGSTFKVYLPRHLESRDDERPVPAAASHLLPGSETILLVEDESALLEIGQEMLRHLGYRVIPAAGPRRALELLQECPEDIHLVITDVVMPEMNGRELVEKIASQRPGLKFLYMSGYTANAIVHRGILDEGLNFIQKPFSLEEMASKIRSVLDSSGA